MYWGQEEKRMWSWDKAEEGRRSAVQLSAFLDISETQM